MQMKHATLITDGDQPAVRLERQLPDPPEVVWGALTEREQQRSLPCALGGPQRPPPPQRSRFQRQAVRHAIPSQRHDGAVSRGLKHASRTRPARCLLNATATLAVAVVAVGVGVVGPRGWSPVS